ncbi:hypothetical protein MTR_6g465830 [Medicago truncatula]|uniref:Transmembrane protein n=1 Tax=Medicago truncatula TaxID=3880 RepID=A0A072UC41_MEDTR|nr:hypothetical protein MTR_6g465830 [Medicago truncatula]
MFFSLVLAFASDLLVVASDEDHRSRGEKCCSLWRAMNGLKPYFSLKRIVSWNPVIPPSPDRVSIPNSPAAPSENNFNRAMNAPPGIAGILTYLSMSYVLIRKVFGLEHSRNKRFRFSKKSPGLFS